MPHPIRRIRARAASEEAAPLGAYHTTASEHPSSEYPPLETPAPVAGPHPAIFAAALAANAAGVFGLLLATGALAPEDLASLDAVMHKLTAPRPKGAPLFVYLLADAVVCSGAVTWLMIRKRRSHVTPGLTNE